MNKNLRNWLTEYVSFDSVGYESNISNLIVDLFISDKCNLCCKHCYFGDSHTIGIPLSIEQWKSVIDLLYNKGVRHFHISGRESSLDNRVIEIISYIKNKENTFSGLVSNGTGPMAFYKSLIKEGIDYLEFSIDGTESTHNFIRGKAVYSQVMNTLNSLSQFSDIIDISTCLNENSIDDFFSIIDLCSDIGIKKFFATPFLASGNGNFFKSFSISPYNYSKLMENSFAYLKSRPNKQIILKYCVPHEITLPLIKKGDFFKQILISYLTDQSELLYSVDGNLIQIALNLLDIKFLHNISITSDGEVIPCSDYIGDRNYLRYSIGNIVKDEIDTIVQNRTVAIKKSLNKIRNCAPA